MSADAVKAQLEQFRADFQRLRSEIAKVIVGQDYLIERMLIGLLADGHVLIAHTKEETRRVATHDGAQPFGFSMRKIAPWNESETYRLPRRSNVRPFGSRKPTARACNTCRTPSYKRWRFT